MCSHNVAMLMIAMVNQAISSTFLANLEWGFVQLVLTTLDILIYNGQLHPIT